MEHALTTFCRLDDLGLEVVGRPRLIIEASRTPQEGLCRPEKLRAPSAGW